MSSLYKSPGVHIESAGDRYISLEKVETGVTAFLGVCQKGPRQEAVRIGSFAQYEKVFGSDNQTMALSVRGFFDNGGRSAYIINVEPEGGLDATPDDFIGQQGARSKGLRILETVDDVDLIVAPDLMKQYKKSLGFSRPEYVLAVQRAMIEHCEKMHERFALLDSLPEMSMSEVQEWRGHFDTSHAAFYYPWVKVRAGEDVGVPVPPSGFVAGQIAKADKTEGVHRAPANLPLEGVVDVSRHLKKRDRDHLFDHRINTLNAFPSRGLRIWGARTLASDEAWKHINVRRLFILIRKSVERYAQWVVFEPNEPTLWKRMTRTIDVFLSDLWSAGALVGGSKEEAFYVKCDEETNPPEARDVGQLLCEIGIAPVKPAEYIIVRITQFTRERTEEEEAEAAEQEAAANAAAEAAAAATPAEAAG
jgi:phage tail sheath protein FI